MEAWLERLNEVAPVTEEVVALLIPAGVGLGLVLAARFAGLVAAAIATSLILGFHALAGAWPEWIPEASTPSTLQVLTGVGAALIVGALEGLLPRRWWVALPLRAAALGGGLWLFVRLFRETEWKEAGTAQLWFFGLWLGALAWCFALDYLARKERLGEVLGLVAMAAGLLAPALMLAEVSAKLAQLLGVLALTLGPLALLAFFRPKLLEGPGWPIVLTTALWGLGLDAFLFPFERPPATPFFLTLAAPLAPALTLLPPIARLRTWQRLAASIGLGATLAHATLVFTLVATTPDPNQAPEAGGSGDYYDELYGPR